MTSNHLRYFIEVVEQKNFTKAAEKLYISQSAISKAIHSLEKELQTSLYVHDTRNFVLTSSGELLYQFAKDVLEYYTMRENELKAKIKNENNILRLGLPPTAGSIYFYSLIRDFKKQNPEIELQINDATSKYIPDLLLEGKLDLGVVIEPYEDERFIKKVAYQTEAVFVVSNQHPLANQKEVDFSTLKEENFIQVTKDFQYRKVFENYCQKAGFIPKIAFETNQWDMIIEMVADHQGVSILPLPLLNNYHSNRIRCISITHPKFPWALTLIRLGKVPVTDAMGKFIDLL